MLETLKIRNIAVIDEAEISFTQGLNILSGETGAGKSIVINSISLLLGGRASADLLRAGCDEGSVEGFFDIAGIPWMKERLERFGFASHGGELLIKRTVSKSGKHRIYVNGELATVAILKEICDDLIDLCGQNEHQSLLKPQVQMNLLDQYGNLLKQAENVSHLFQQVRALSKELDILKSTEEERRRKSDFLRFQIDELTELALQPGEDQKLREEKIFLQTSTQRTQLAEVVRQSFDGNDENPGALSILHQALTKLRSLGEMDPAAKEMCEGVERTVAELEDVSLRMNRYLEGSDLNPERLDEVQARLSQIADFRRKYGDTVDDMLSTLQRLNQELRALGDSNERIGALEDQLVTRKKEMIKKGTDLSKMRKKFATVLEESVTAELKDLRMGDATFQIQLDSFGTDAKGLSQWTASTGADTIQFLVQTNRGEETKPISKIASGGELSRLMLSIRRVISDKGRIGVYLFDEIDAGIGGQTAFQVGKKLKSVAQYHQVICITHLPQVASFADHHLSVRKKVQGKRTTTEIVCLGEEEKKNELARMLGGDRITPTSLQNAAELMEMAR